MKWLPMKDFKLTEHGAEYLAMLDGGNITLVIYDKFDDCFNDSYDGSPYQRREIMYVCKIELPEDHQYQS